MRTIWKSPIRDALGVLRRVHLVRPDLIPFPVMVEVVA